MGIIVMSSARQHRITELDYLQRELQSDVKHEFIDGEVFAMVGASSAHNLIAGNVHTALNLHLKGKPCRPYINDMKVRVESNYYYPDVLVDCSDLADDAYFAETPILIVEILSASTKSYDKTFKLQQYKKISTLQEYVMIEQNEAIVSLASALLWIR
jgi:Uma2 family endonuclease